MSLCSLRRLRWILCSKGVSVDDREGMRKSRERGESVRSFYIFTLHSVTAEPRMKVRSHRCLDNLIEGSDRVHCAQKSETRSSIEPSIHAITLLILRNEDSVSPCSLQRQGTSQTEMTREQSWDCESIAVGILGRQRSLEQTPLH